MPTTPSASFAANAPTAASSDAGTAPGRHPRRTRPQVREGSVYAPVPRRLHPPPSGCSHCSPSCARTAARTPPPPTRSATASPRSSCRPSTLRRVCCPGCTPVTGSGAARRPERAQAQRIQLPQPLPAGRGSPGRAGSRGGSALPGAGRYDHPCWSGTWRRWRRRCGPWSTSSWDSALRTQGIVGQSASSVTMPRL
jgi:hypothetical protein